MQEVFDEIRSALHTVWNRRWVALGVAWVICVLGWLAIAFIPNSYESRARIYVELEDVLSEQLDISGDGKQAITKVRQTLVSGVNLERVIRTTKLGEKVVTDAEMQAAVKVRQFFFCMAFQHVFQKGSAYSTDLRVFVWHTIV